MNRKEIASPFKTSFDRPLIPGRFVERTNRFVAQVAIDGVMTPVHVPNTGRMKELLVEGREVWLLPQDGKHRKTRYDLLLVSHADRYVCVDSGEANRFMSHLFTALMEGKTKSLPNPEASIWQAFMGIREMKREVALEKHRFDFCLQKSTGPVWVEVKSVNLVEDGLALFPDAPTVRGRHHVDLLGEQVSQGAEAHVVFVVQRSDAHAFSANYREDPKFADALHRAAQAGVGIHAIGLRMTPEGSELIRILPIKKAVRGD